MKREIIINADMGEGFGQYQLCNDDELMPYVSSVNLACGFHAGDPMVMNHAVKEAKKNGVSIGAHPGFRDLQGFGRRMLAVTEEELYCDLMYQFGALNSFVQKEHVKLTHVCPHGVMDTLVSENRNYGKVFIQAIKDFDPALKVILEEKCLLASMCREEGIKVAAVGYPDLDYDSDGNMVISRKKQLMNPDKVVDQALRMVLENKYQLVDGKTLPIHVDVLCLHSDVPNSLEILKKLNKAFESNQVAVVPF